MQLIYSFSIFLYTRFISVAAFFHPKAKQWINGRKNVFKNLENVFNSSDYVCWFHCASLGEFEQGKPLMLKLKKEHPNYKILITFFSPSGYELKKNCEFAAHVCYLPIDTKKNAAQFINLVKPNEVFFVKYEFWNFYLHALKSKNIPTYLLSGVFRNSQPFFKFYGNFHRKMLGCFTYFFLQNTESEELLHKIHFKNTLVSGDTRIDNVYKNAQQPNALPLIKKFTANRKTIVLGSSWKEEEEIIAQFMQSTPTAYNYIIAPHDVSNTHLSKIKNTLKTNFLLFSDANDSNINQFNVLIIDNIGMLSAIYQYTDIAFVGGGFSGALHNVLEPASFGNAILFGPKFKKFHEAAALISENAAFSVDSLDDFIAITNHLMQENVLEKTKNAASNYVKNNLGATDKIWKMIYSNYKYPENK